MFVITDAERTYIILEVKTNVCYKLMIWLEKLKTQIYIQKNIEIVAHKRIHYTAGSVHRGHVISFLQK